MQVVRVYCLQQEQYTPAGWRGLCDWWRHLTLWRKATVRVITIRVARLTWWMSISCSVIAVPVWVVRVLIRVLTLWFFARQPPPPFFPYPSLPAPHIHESVTWPRVTHLEWTNTLGRQVRLDKRSLGLLSAGDSSQKPNVRQVRGLGVRGVRVGEVDKTCIIASNGRDGGLRLTCDQWVYRLGWDQAWSQETRCFLSHGGSGTEDKLASTHRHTHKKLVISRRASRLTNR